MLFGGWAILVLAEQIGENCKEKREFNQDLVSGV